MASIKDISEKVGVSITAVSKYLRDPDTKHVSQINKEKINRAVRELNYSKNVFASSLSSKKGNLISILIPFNAPFSKSTFLNEILSGIESILLNRGYNITFLATKGNDSPSMVKNQLKEGGGFAGSILIGSRFCTRDDIINNSRELLKAGTPFVLLNSPDIDLNVSQIVFKTPEQNNPQTFLLSQGHRKIIYMMGRESSPATEDELDLIKRNYESFGLSFDDGSVYYADYEMSTSKRLLIDAVEKDPEITAVYCLTDTMALGVYEAARELNIRIPEDLSVVGKHDSFFAQYMHPQLTSLRVKSFEGGAAAGRLLIDMINNQASPRKITFDNELILRLSTRVIS